MIYVFSGKGKGKTMAACGMAIRAMGAGQKVLMIQFLKPGTSSEVKAIRKIKNFDFKSFGRPGFGPYSKRDKALVLEGLDFLKKEAGRYDLIILDEINIALSFGLISAKKLLAVLKGVPKNLDLVLTGRGCPKEIIEAADLVTNFVEVKHYYKKGVKAQKGREL